MLLEPRECQVMYGLSCVLDIRAPDYHYPQDERSHYTFERAIEWNYTLIEGDAYLIPPHNPLFEQVREVFIHKNPWEMAFFLREDLEMYHIKSRQLVCPGSQQAVVTA